MYKLLFLALLLIFFNGKSQENFEQLNHPPNYNPNAWNQPGLIKTNNCYAYVLNNLRSRSKKPQPGRFAGIVKKNNYNSCKETFNRVKKDNPDVYKIEPNGMCKDGYYKGFLAMDPGKDYHFYRQDSDNYWSHKPGKNKATNLDSSGNRIVDPRTANRIYKQFKYTKECNFMCIPKNTNAI